MFLRLLLFLICSGLAFAAVADAAPTLSHPTYLRDSFTPTAIATDPEGNICLAGNAIVDAFTPQTTVLVIKLNPQASQYLYDESGALLAARGKNGSLTVAVL
jgi:hypothetical protein